MDCWIDGTLGFSLIILPNRLLMTTFTSTAVLFGVLIIFSLPASADSRSSFTQDADKPTPSEYVYTAVHVNSFPDLESVVIDGNLNEPIYDKLEAITDFTQAYPDEAAPISEKTKVHIFYDDKNIYVSFICFDREPEKISAKLENRDDLHASDRFGVLLDTFGDRRSGFFFVINPKGIQADANLSEVRGRGGTASSVFYDYSWNGVWQGAATLFEQGWMAEMAIPFKTIKYSSQPEQTWGINLTRIILRKNEYSLWFPQKRFNRGIRPAYGGFLKGLTNLPQYRHLDLIPFVSLRRVSSSEFISEAENLFPNIGMDARYNLTPNLVANVTLNPDFSQTEVDEENVNLSRWELFYPEKREFFTDGGVIFDTPLRLFFSRRIGELLPDNSEQRIVLGTKITGKVGKQQIGIIETVTGEATYFEGGESHVREGANFFVFRVQRDILEKSTIGFLTVNRDQKPDLETHTQRSHGVDLNLNFGDHVRIKSQLAFSFNPGDSESLVDKRAYEASFNYNSNLFDVDITRRDVGPEFNIDQTGFYPEVDRIGNELGFGVKPFIDRWAIRQLTFSMGYNQLDNHQGELEYSGLDFGFSQEWKNYWTTGVGFTSEKELYYIFHDGEKLPEKTLYDVPYKMLVFLRIPAFNTINGSLNYQTGDFIDYNDNYVGRFHSFYADLTAKLGANLRVGGRVNYIQQFYSNGEREQVRGLYLVRVGYSFTNKLRSRLLVQYNLETKQLITDALVFYELTSRSGIYLGFRDRNNRGVGRYIEPEDTRLFFKFSHLVAF